MKRIFYIATLLWIMGAFKFTYGQKAYDKIVYKAYVNNYEATLILADGYLLASKIIIHSKQGDQLFAPTENEADEQGRLRFDAVNGSVKRLNRKGAVIYINNLDNNELPAMVKASYWDGKASRSIVFKKAE